MGRKKLEPYLSTKEISKISFGNGLDTILNGGLETKTVTQFYGPPASGKTNLCLLAIVRCVAQGKKAVFIDTEGGHSIERLRQIAGDDLDAVLENSYFYEPTNFTDQQFRFERNDENASVLNKALASQVSKLSALSRKHNLAVIITTQVYASFEVENGVEPVGGSMLKYWSKVIVELKREGRDVEAVLVRHRGLAEGISVRFHITDKGIQTFE
jgi:DNA repair protein RadB